MDSGNDNTDADPEVLVAIGRIINKYWCCRHTEVELVTTSDKSEGFNIWLESRFNEPVDVLQQVVHQHSQLQMITEWIKEESNTLTIIRIRNWYE